MLIRFLKVKLLFAGAAVRRQPVPGRALPELRRVHHGPEVRERVGLHQFRGGLCELRRGVLPAHLPHHHKRLPLPQGILIYLFLFICV